MSATKSKTRAAKLQSRNQSARTAKVEQISAPQIPTAAPSVTIAPRNPARGVIIFVVTLTDFRYVRSYPCRTMEKALTLATRFVSSVVQSKPHPAA